MCIRVRGLHGVTETNIFGIDLSVGDPLTGRSGKKGCSDLKTNLFGNKLFARMTWADFPVRE